MYCLHALLTVMLIAGAYSDDDPRPYEVMLPYSARLYAEIKTHNRTPQFLKDSSPAARNEFIEFIKSASVTEKVMKQKINTWLKKQPACVRVSIFHLYCLGQASDCSRSGHYDESARQRHLSYC